MGNWKSVPLMLVATLITGPVTAEMDFPAWTQSDWRIEENRAALNARTPASMRTPVLILGENRRTASESVVILIDAPFESVRPVVEQIWEKRGYAVEKASLPLADLVSQWQQIMLAAQPDLRSALVDGVYGPALAQAVKEGALTETERRQRLQRLAVRTQATEDALLQVPVFRKEAQRSRFYREQRVDDDARWVDDYSILDLRLIMGLPVTAVTVKREHILRVPRQILSGLADSPQFFKQGLVPGDDFQETLAALTQALPDAALRLAESPEVWKPAVPMPPELPAPDWRHPPESAAIEPAVRSLRTTDALTLRAVHSLPGGALIVGVQREARLNDETVLIAQLWRLVPEAATPEVLWQGLSGADDLHANPKGSRFWFTGQPLNSAQTALFQYQQGEGVSALDLPAEDRQRLPFAQWWVNGEDPVIAAYSVSNLRHLEGGMLSSPQPVPRKEWFPNGLRLLAGGAAPWVEDGQGVAELDPESGRVTRSLQVPARRDGLPGASPWPGLDPRAMKGNFPGIVSAKGKWLATAFSFEEKDGGSLAGVHLFDTDKSELLYSAVLPGAGSVRLTASSSDGRWLAIYGGNGLVFLWDVRGNSAPLRLNADSVYLEDLTFSNDSRYLYGVGNEHILTWQWRN